MESYDLVEIDKKNWDYKTEQAAEVEEMNVLFAGEMKILQSEPLHKFIAPVQNGEGVFCNLIFTLPAKYPDDPPIVVAEDLMVFDEPYRPALEEHIQSLITKNMGIEMIFAIIAGTLHWYVEKLANEKKDG